MIESSGTYAGTHYYHYDALGSVVAMTNSSGTVVQLYEYSVYGQVAASDADHPNRFMFTGREFDKDTGLYYYRARYYNPEIGRFLQTDPIGYGDGMNWYAYCGGNPLSLGDPSGMASGFSFSRYKYYLSDTLYYDLLRFSWLDESGVSHEFLCRDIDQWLTWAHGGGEYFTADNQKHLLFPKGWGAGEVGWTLAGCATVGSSIDQDWWFLTFKALMWLDGSVATTIQRIEDRIRCCGASLSLNTAPMTVGMNGTVDLVLGDGWTPGANVLTLLPEASTGTANWQNSHYLTKLAHELQHMYNYFCDGPTRASAGVQASEHSAVNAENRIRSALFTKSWEPGVAQTGVFS